MDTAESEQIEEHLFGCEACSAQLARVASIAEVLRTQIPIVVVPEQVRDLRDRGLVVDENPVTQGSRQQVEFPAGVDILLHRLQGLDLSDAKSVHVRVRSESTGDILTEDHFAPFNRERGEVLVACQRHFSDMPPDIAFDVLAHDSAGHASRTTFHVPHVFLP